MGNCASAKVVVHAGDDDAQPVARSPSAGKLAKESGSEVTNRSPTPGGSVAGFVTSCNTEALADGQQSAKTAQVGDGGASIVIDIFSLSAPIFSPPSRARKRSLLKRGL